jgi:two-component system chemotaxis response regulator CheB
MMTKTRVLVVEDSLTVRKRLVEVLSADPELEVVAEAEDGKRAIELCLALRPDVITLDMMLPVMSGLAATEYIMAHCPTPIVIVSASTNRGELFRTYDALAAGAVEVVEKPRGDDADESWERHFISTVKLVARIKVITHLRGRLRRETPVTSIVMENGASAQHRVVAIGASTGGPGAVVELLRGLPSHFPLPVLLIIHVGATFATAMAEWLDGLSPLRVAFARDGERLPQIGDGRVILAPPDRHLLVSAGRLRLSDEDERHSCRPSIDVLFESLAREHGAETIACLLTGMGKDGAAGLLALRRAGGLTVAQDESTSVVFGMPREAIALGAAERVLPIGRIAPTINEVAVRDRKKGR